MTTALTNAISSPTLWQQARTTASAVMGGATAQKVAGFATSLFNGLKAALFSPRAAFLALPLAGKVVVAAALAGGAYAVFKRYYVSAPVANDVTAQTETATPDAGANAEANA